MDINCQVPPLKPPTPPGPTNTPPVLQPIPSQQCEVGGQIVYQLQASDADGDTLVYSFTPTTSGVSIDQNTGIVTINCLTTGPFGITVTVSDGNGGTDTEQFNWIVSDIQTVVCDDCIVDASKCASNPRIAYFDDGNTSPNEVDWKQADWLRAMIGDLADFVMYGVNVKVGQSSQGSIDAINGVYDTAGYSGLVNTCNNIPLPSITDLKAATLEGGTFEIGNSNSTVPANGKSTPASNKLKQEILASTPSNPLWVAIGGPPVDIAQALFELSNGTAAEQIAYKNIRIFSVGNYNTLVAGPGANQWLYNYMTSSANDLWWVDTSSATHYPNSGSTSNPRTFAYSYLTTTQCPLTVSNSSTNFLNNLQAINPAFPDALSGDTTGFRAVTLGDMLPIFFILSQCLTGTGNIDDPTVSSAGGKYMHFNQNLYPNYYIDISDDSDITGTAVCENRDKWMRFFEHRFEWYNQ